MQYRSKTDLVAAEIRSLISSGELGPGAVLRQRDLAERLGVSPTPVREALRRLEAEGFVVTQPHRGASVVRSEDARLNENALIRAALEGLAAQLAAGRIDDEQLSQIERLHNELADATDDERRLELNRRLHFAVYSAAGSPVMLAQLRLLWRMLDGGPRVDRPLEESVAQHAQLIEALRARDGERAAAITRHHILSAYHLPDMPSGTAVPAARS